MGFVVELRHRLVELHLRNEPGFQPFSQSVDPCSNLFGGGWPESERCSVRLTTLDEAYPQKPSKHLYVRSVAPWETLPDDGAERHDTRSG